MNTGFYIFLLFYRPPTIAGEKKKEKHSTVPCKSYSAYASIIFECKSRFHPHSRYFHTRAYLECVRVGRPSHLFVWDCGLMSEPSCCWSNGWCCSWQVSRFNHLIKECLLCCLSMRPFQIFFSFYFLVWGVSRSKVSASSIWKLVS